MMDKNRLICMLSVLCVLSVGVMIFALCSGGKQAPFTPPPFDPAAQAGTPAVPGGLGYQTLPAGPFLVAICGQISAEGTDAPVYLTNPAGNEVWLKVRLMDESGAVLGESGLVRPGEYVRNIRLRQIPAPGMPITLKIMAYEPDTYHSAGSVLLNTHMGE